MEYKLHSHRFAWQIISQTDELRKLWEEIAQSIRDIDDAQLIEEFNRQQTVSAEKSKAKRKAQGEDEENAKGSKMSLSMTINTLLDKSLASEGWVSQSALFQGKEYSSGTRWRLDFSKQLKFEKNPERPNMSSEITGIAVEVAFNHGEAIAWNLLKPVMAAELNHVDKETDIGAGIGVVICATNSLKKAGAFDGSVGTYEKFLRYLKPMNNQLTVPMLIIGLEPPKTFKIKKSKNPETKRNMGVIVHL